LKDADLQKKKKWPEKANHGYHRPGGKREEESEMEKQEALRSQIVAQYTELASNH
jgi:hypothetical protein